jgi:hypothetical protein
LTAPSTHRTIGIIVLQKIVVCPLRLAVQVCAVFVVVSCSVDARAQSVEGHGAAGVAIYASDRGYTRYFNAIGGLEVRNPARFGLDAGSGLFIGDGEGAFALQVAAVAHSQRRGSLRPSFFLGGGFTLLPEHSALHVKAGQDRWMTGHVALRIEGEVLRRFERRRAWIGVLRLGLAFR